jgi:hypothetical protein
MDLIKLRELRMQFPERISMMYLQYVGLYTIYEFIYRFMYNVIIVVLCACPIYMLC